MLAIPPPIKLQPPETVFSCPPAIEDKVPLLVCVVPIVSLDPEISPLNCVLVIEVFPIVVVFAP